MGDRTLIDLRNDFSIIKSNKLNTTQSKALFMGLLYEIIMRKDLFPKKENLKIFIENIILNNKPDLVIKDYLYRSRSNLAARLMKAVLEYDYIEIVKVMETIYQLMPENEIKSTKLKSKGNLSEDVISWMKFIGENKNNE